MEKLAALAAQQQQLEPISAHVDKLNAQLADNKAILDDLERNVAHVTALKTAAGNLMHDTQSEDENAQGPSDVSSLQRLMLPIGKQTFQSYSSN